MAGHRSASIVARFAIIFTSGQCPNGVLLLFLLSKCSLASCACKHHGWLQFHVLTGIEEGSTAPARKWRHDRSFNAANVIFTTFRLLYPNEETWSSNIAVTSAEGPMFSRKMASRCNSHVCLMHCICWWIVRPRMVWTTRQLSPWRCKSNFRSGISPGLFDMNTQGVSRGSLLFDPL